MHYQEVPPLGQPSGRRGIPAWLVVGVGLVLLTIAAVVVTLRNGSPTATVAESASTKATPKSPAVTAKTKAVEQLLLFRFPVQVREECLGTAVTRDLRLS